MLSRFTRRSAVLSWSPPLGTRTEDLVEQLDLPAHGVPVEHLDRVRAGSYRQIRDQLPVDPRPVFGWMTLLCVDHRQAQGG